MAKTEIMKAKTEIMKAVCRTLENEDDLQFLIRLWARLNAQYRLEHAIIDTFGREMERVPEVSVKAAMIFCKNYHHPPKRE